MNKTSIRIALSLLLVASATASFAETSGVTSEGLALTVDPSRSRLSFEVDSTLHTVEGDVPEFEGSVRISPSEASANLEIPAASLVTGNGGRDKKMRSEVLLVSDYQLITYSVQQVDGDLQRLLDGHLTRLTLQGNLQLVGQDLPLAIPVRARLVDGVLSVNGATTLELDRWEVPDVSGFLLKVAREVTVSFQMVASVDGPGATQVAGRQ